MVKLKPYISETDVQHALNAMKNSASEEKFVALCNLLLVESIRKDPNYPDIENHAYAVYTLLTRIITDELMRHRYMHGVKSPLDAESAIIYEEHIQLDHRANSEDLSLWSYLFHTYVVPELNLSSEGFAEIVGTSDRTIRRLRPKAIHRLTQYLINTEWEAQVHHRRKRLYAQLPQTNHMKLFGRDVPIGQALSIIEKTPNATLLVTGPPGIGKTSFVQYIVHTLIDSQGDMNVDDLLWIMHPKTVDDIYSELAKSLDEHGSWVDVRTWLLTYQVIIVIDDAARLIHHESEEFASLLHLLEPGLVFLVSSLQTSMQNVTHRITLHELTYDDAKVFFRDMYHHHRQYMDMVLAEEDFSYIYGKVGGNPSGLSLMLRNTIIHEMDTHTLSFTELFGRIHNQLDVETKNAWYCFVLCPNMPIASDDMCNLWPHVHLGHLNNLANHHLIQRVSSESYTLPSLARQFIINRYRQGDSEVAKALQDNIYLISQTIVDCPEFAAKVVTHIKELEWLDLQTDTVNTWSQIFNNVSRGHTIAPKRKHIEILDSIVIAYDPYRDDMERGIAFRRLTLWHEAEQVFNALIQRTGQDGDFIAQAGAIVELSIILRLNGQYEKAISTLQRAQKVAERYKEINLLDTIYLEYAQIAIESHNPTEAFLLLNCVDESGRKSARYYMARAEAYFLAEQSAEAREQAMQALSFAGQKRQTTGQIYNLIGRSYMVEENHSEAYHYFSVAKTYFNAANDLFSSARCDSNIGAVRISQGFFTEAKQVLRHAHTLQSQLGDKLGLHLTNHNLRILYNLEYQST